MKDFYDYEEIIKPMDTAECIAAMCEGDGDIPITGPEIELALDPVIYQIYHKRGITQDEVDNAAADVICRCDIDYIGIDDYRNNVDQYEDVAYLDEEDISGLIPPVERVKTGVLVDADGGWVIPGMTAEDLAALEDDDEAYDAALESSVHAHIILHISVVDDLKAFQAKYLAQKVREISEVGRYDVDAPSWVWDELRKRGDIE